jgi:hypothetical protein
LLKKARKNFGFPRRQSGHSLTAQKPGELRVFCGAFFKKATACLTSRVAITLSTRRPCLLIARRGGFGHGEGAAPGGGREETGLELFW